MIGKNNPLTYVHVGIPVKLAHSLAKLPTQANGDVGFDVYSIETVTLPPKEVRRVKTGLLPAESIEPIVLGNKIVAIPYLKLETRSGMASKGVFVEGGVIDPRYRGEIEVVLFNSTDKEVEYVAGSRVAQLVVYLVLANAEPYHGVKFHSADNVENTDRGNSGFGSTGV